MLLVLVCNEHLQRDSYTFLQIFWESPTYHLDHPVPQRSFEINCPGTFIYNRSFSLSRNKKNKSKTIQWKKLWNYDVIEDN